MMGYYGYGDMHDWGLLGAGMMIIFWVFIALFFVWLARAAFGGYRGHHGHGHWHGGHALDILKERYAKGEINKEEYESKKKDLEN